MIIFFIIDAFSLDFLTENKDLISTLIGGKAESNLETFLNLLNFDLGELKKLWSSLKDFIESIKTGNANGKSLSDLFSKLGAQFGADLQEKLLKYIKSSPELSGIYQCVANNIGGNSNSSSSAKSSNNKSTTKSTTKKFKLTDLLG